MSVKTSDLPLTDTLDGLFTYGVDKDNNSVKVSLEFIEKTTTDAVAKATTAAQKATDAATTATNAASEASTSASAANKAATSANTATSKANTATTKANSAADSALEAANYAQDIGEVTDGVRKEAEAATAKANEAADSVNTAIANAESSVATMQENVDAAISDAKAATSAATYAASSAESNSTRASGAAQYAETAGKNATVAANDANTAATSANDAAASAATATTKATEAAEKADTATSNATAAMVNANDAAEKATKAAENAAKSAENANTAVSDANDVIDACNEAISQAKAATENAISATTAAETATADTNKALEAIAPYTEELCAYGVEFSTDISSPTCTRIGRVELHKECPIQNRMRGCLLDDEGNVVEYLDPTDWTGNTRDGSRGQVMVELPEHYRKFETDGNKRRVWLSEYVLPGYHKVPKSYVSAYQASLQRSTLMLSSVINLSEDFRGGNNKADYDGTDASLLGMPATSITRPNFRKYARNRNTDSTAWNCMVYDVWKEIFWLFVVEYATLNSQADYNAELTSEGYRQGGLGAGVTKLSGSLWNTFNSYNPFIPCGYTDALGNRTGVVAFTMPESYSSSEVITYVPRYRGIENPFGHLWIWTDGCNIQASAPTDAGGTGLNKVFVCSDPSKFNDSNYTGYSHVGNESRTSGYVKEIIFGEGGEIIGKTVGAGSNSYFCDYLYTSNPASGESLRGLLLGGSADHGSAAGFAFAFSSVVPSRSNTDIGSRLCFIPV